jgi:hypothetical protein
VFTFQQKFFDVALSLSVVIAQVHAVIYNCLFIHSVSSTADVSTLNVNAIHWVCMVAFHGMLGVEEMSNETANGAFHHNFDPNMTQ